MAHFVFASPHLFLLLLFGLHAARAQQVYEDNYQLNCANKTYSTLGYSCNNGSLSSCFSYLLFRSQPGYQSPVEIASLLNADPSSIAQANGISDTTETPTDTAIVVPIYCSCSAGFYQHNASHTFKRSDLYYFHLANNTYQGLTTCQALISQNPYNPMNLTAGLELVVPLRCACPTSNQLSSGVKYLLTYLITWGDDIPSIASRYNSDEASVMDANRLSSDSIIYPFTTLLVPLESEISKAGTPPQAAPGAQDPFVVPPDGGSKAKKWLFVGIGAGIGFLVPSGVLLLWFSYRHRRWLRRRKSNTLTEEGSDCPEGSSELGELSEKRPASLAA